MRLNYRKIVEDRIALNFSIFEPLHNEVLFAMKHAKLPAAKITEVIELVRSAAHELGQHTSTAEVVGPMRNPDEAFVRLRCIAELLRIDANRGRIPPEAVRPILAVSSRLTRTVSAIVRKQLDTQRNALL